MDFLTENSIFLVFIITLIIWLGLAYLMFSIDNKVKKLEKDFVNFKEKQ